MRLYWSVPASKTIVWKTTSAGLEMYVDGSLYRTFLVEDQYGPPIKVGVTWATPGTIQTPDEAYAAYHRKMGNSYH